MRIAVIGGGIAGLACAWRLVGERAVSSQAVDVTLFEAGAVAGGHAHTVDVTLDGRTHPVDTGFLVFNRRTYPQLVALFASLDVATTASEMTFSVQVAGRRGLPLEWAGTDLNSVFVQRRRLASPRFLRMLADLARFNRRATALALAGDVDDSISLGAFLDAHRYSAAFRDWYLLPMAAAIWSCSTEQMRAFPLATFVRFCANHGLLQVLDRPQWYTVTGGSRRYVDRMVAKLPDVRLSTPVLGVEPAMSADARVGVRTARGVEHFDRVVLACHSDQAAELLGDRDRDPARREVLHAIRYQPNHAVLHTDASVLPRRRGAWAAWNYHADASAVDRSRVAVHYLINRLQPLPFASPVIVSLNPSQRIDPARVVERFEYAHPLFDRAAIAAQRRLDDIQGRDGLRFCGAWTGYGFHEDGLRSGLAAAESILDARSRSRPEARLAA